MRAFFISNNSNMTFYTYIYFDPRPEKNFEAIYVGKGKRNRWQHHLKDCKNSSLKGKIKNIRAAGFEPHVEIIKAPSEKSAFMMETFWIGVFGRIDLKTGSLCNFTSGGEGGRDYSDEVIAKCIAGGKMRKGFKLSDDHKKRISDSNKGKVPSAERLAKQSIAMKGRKLTEEHKEKIREGVANAVISDEARERMARAKRGKPTSPEAKAKLAESIRLSWIKRKAKKLEEQNKIIQEVEECL